MSIQSQTPIALPLVIYENSKFIIPKEAKALLSNDSFKNIGIISLVGKYRTGKSFLLNRVLLNRKQEKGFGVGPTFKPCTKGIWIWSEPIQVNNKYSPSSFPCFLIDTEGLCAYDEEINHDTKIFLISILISSLFIYNSFGAIDETTITSLSFVLNLSKTIKVHNNSIYDSDNELAEYFPTLLWLLRDFHLKLEDTKGNSITEAEYLEKALQNVKGSTEAIEEKNQVRTLIRTYFPERDCFTMVRPVEKENELQNLQQLDDYQLRSEFIEQAEEFRQRIYNIVKPKIFMKASLTGSMLIEFIQSVLNAINEGSIPVIENSWKYVIQNECIKKTNTGIERFKEELDQYRKANEANPNFFKNIGQYTKTLLAKYVNDFNSINKDLIDNDYGGDDFVLKYKQKLNTELENFNKENALLCEKKFTSNLESMTQSFLDSLVAGDNNSSKYNKNHYAFFQDIDKLRNQLEDLTPDFPSKSDLILDKLMIIIKRFIEIHFIKSKQQSDKEITAFKALIDKLQLKLKSTTDELTKLKQEHSSYLEKMNSSIVDDKLKQKTFEDKLQVLINEKKIERERYERNIQQLKTDHEKTFESTITANKQLQNELKIKDDQLTMLKTNNSKVIAINDQKILFLDKELSAMKDKCASITTEFKFKESSFVNEISLLKAQNESLKNEMKQFTYTKKTTDAMNSNFNNLEQCINEHFNNQRKENKSLLHNMITQQKEKEKDTLNAHSALSENNKLMQSLSTIESKNKQLEDQMSKLMMYKDIVGQSIGFKCRTCMKLLTLDQFKGHLKQCLNQSQSQMKKGMLLRNSTSSNDLVKLKIIKGRVLQDELGKPFLEYIIDVELNGQNWRVNKRFNQFANLYKAMKTLFQGVITFPQSASIFVNINEMNSSNSFHENKINQLDMFIKDLAMIDVVNRSKIFRRFFEFERYIDEDTENVMGVDETFKQEENDNEDDGNEANEGNDDEDNNYDKRNEEYDYDYQID